MILLTILYFLTIFNNYNLNYLLFQYKEANNQTLMYIDEKFQLFMKILNDFFFDSNDLNGNAKTRNYFKNESDTQDNDNHCFFLCRKCHQIPIISFFEGEIINVECGCSHYKNIEINHIIEDYMIDEQSNNKIYNNCKCKRHSLKYYAYCDDCSNDICEQCLSKEEELHSTHTLLIFPNIYEKCKKILDYVTQSKNEIFEEEKSILKIFNTILDDYRRFPSYTCYQNIYNCISFLNKLNEKEKEKEFNHKENKKMEYYIKIRNIRDLKNIINNHPMKINIIESININSQNFYDLNLLKLNNKLTNYAQLISLDLKQNNISDIKPLSLILFPQLEKLDLSNNRLSDESIVTLKNLICPKLKKLNLSSNAFTKYDIFECCKNYEQLESFHIGYNKINKNLKNNKNKDFNYEFPQTLEELDVSNGIFSKKSINIIKYFKFDNLKKLFVCSNNLNSLSFVEKINCDNLEEFWLSNNYLKEYENLKKFKKLKVINLQKNKIKNISNLNEFLKEFPNIEKVNLINNNIDLDDIENEKIINKAKKHRNSSNDKIQIFF